MPCTRSIVPRRADRLRHDPVRLDAFPAFRYTAILRPGGGTADASVSKTDIERCVGSNPTPGTILSWKSPNNRTERTRSPSHGGVRASDHVDPHAARDEAPRTAGFEHGTNVSRETFVHVFSCDGTKKAFRSSAGWKRKAFCLCSDVLGGVLYSVKSFSPLNTAMASSTE